MALVLLAWSRHTGTSVGATFVVASLDVFWKLNPFPLILLKRLLLGFLQNFWISHRNCCISLWFRRTRCYGMQGRFRRFIGYFEFSPFPAVIQTFEIGFCLGNMCVYFLALIIFWELTQTVRLKNLLNEVRVLVGRLNELLHILALMIELVPHV